MSVTGAARAGVVDLGGTRFRVALGTEEGILEWRVSRPTEVERPVEAVLADLYTAVEEALASSEQLSAVKGLAIGAPGPLDPWEGVIHSPPNMPGWDGVPLKRLFSDRFGLPTEVANDANLAAIGEHRYGEGRGFADVVYVTVSTGIGGGVILRNRLVLGHAGFAGEVGHMVIDMDADPCSCGNRGCLEALASGTAIARHARAAVAHGARTSLSSLKEHEVTAQAVSEAAYRGDDVARGLLVDAGTALGVGMVNLAQLYNPRRIILGGGVSINAGPILWDAMRAAVQARAGLPALRDLEIVPAGLGDDAGLLGGVALMTTDSTGG